MVSALFDTKKGFDHWLLRRMVSEFELQQLMHQWQIAQKIVVDGTLACYVILTLIILAFISIFAWNGSYRKLPNFVKVALPAYLIYAMYSGGVFVYMHLLSYEEQLSSFYDGTG